MNLDFFQYTVFLKLQQEMNTFDVSKQRLKNWYVQSINQVCVYHKMYTIFMQVDELSVVVKANSENSLISTV